MITFDTHEYVKELMSVGFTEQQAEIQSHAIARVIENDLATKRDVEIVRRDIEIVRKDMRELELSMKRDIAEAKSDIIKWVAGMLVAQAGIVAAIVKLL